MLAIKYYLETKGVVAERFLEIKGVGAKRFLATTFVEISLDYVIFTSTFIKKMIFNKINILSYNNVCI